jgi:hypothetical protein
MGGGGDVVVSFLKRRLGGRGAGDVLLFPVWADTADNAAGANTMGGREPGGGAKDQTSGLGKGRGITDDGYSSPPTKRPEGRRHETGGCGGVGG